MDRKYKAANTVLVYATSRGEKPVGLFTQAPHSACGFDNYKWEDRMYKGFYKDDETYILLSEPV